MSHQSKMSRAYNHAGVIVSIDFVDNGLACNCTCVDCGAQLVAKQGKEQVHHFAHKSGDPKASSCTWSYETDLHIIAKEVLMMTKCLPVTFGTDAPYVMNIEFDSVLQNASSTIKDSNIRPDLVATYSGETIYIEISVSSSCKQEKIIEFRRLDLTVIEVYLQNFEPTSDVMTLDEVKKCIEYADKKWLNIKPAGYIGSLVNEQERTVLRDLVNSRSQAQEDLKYLEKKAKEVNYFLAQYENETNYKRSKIASLNNQIYKKGEDLQELHNNYRASEKVLRKTCDNLKKDIALLENDKEYILEGPKIDLKAIKRESEQVALEAFNKKVKSLEEAYEAKLKSTESTLKINIRELETTINKLNQQCSVQENKKVKLVEKNSKLQVFETELHKKEKHLNAVSTDMQHKVVLHRQAAMNLERMTPELRGLTRKFGIAWPFADSLVDELKKELAVSVEELQD